MTKQMSIWSMVLLGIVLVGSTGCLFAKKPATFDTIHNLNVEKVSTSPLTLRVSGGSMDSSRRVSKVVSKKEGDSIRVMVYLTLGRGTGSGHFSELLEIDSSVTQVTFGSEGKVIWKWE